MQRAGIKTFIRGMILLWSGSIATIPEGWHICDGNAGTPDLTDRFVIHADADAAGTNNVGATGGVSSHILTINEMPSHSHNQKITGGGSGAYAINVAECYIGGHTDCGTTYSTGGGAAHTNRDKYYALAYIMKL